MDKMRINLQDLLLCLSNAQDLISSNLSMHHQKVACIAYRIAEQLELPVNQRRDIFLAALIHDIGALSIDMIADIRTATPDEMNEHAFRGAKLLQRSKHLKQFCPIIRHHHIPWNYGEGVAFKGADVPLASHVVNLADFVCAQILPGVNVITQLPGILADVKQRSGSEFHPSLVEALMDISKREYVWLDMVSRSPVSKIPDIGLFNVLVLDTKDIMDITGVFSQIIDFRSPFTSRHSAGVATTAERLAFLAGLSPYECKMMKIAGDLHDLGKIAISPEILEKPAKLNEEEFNEMRSHTYFTFSLLEPIEEFNTINIWASYHHERLDGNGYPFHIKGDNISLGSRIMAVADVFTAITENRPYRDGMADEIAKRVLTNMAASGGIDERLVGILLDNYQDINDRREKAQQEVAKRYEEFLKMD